MDKIICTVCGSDENKILYHVKDVRIKADSKKLFDLYRCLNCELIFLYPLPKFKDIKEFYGSNYFTMGYIKKGNKLWGFLKAIKRKIFGISRKPFSKFYRNKNSIFTKKEGKFLDIGCATGVQNIELIKEFPGWEFNGVEPDEFAYKEALTVRNFNVKKGLLNDAVFLDNYFDVILLNQVLEHTNDPRNTLNECRRILRSNGQLIIAVPDSDSLSSKIFGKNWYHIDAPRHLYNFNKKSLSKLISGSTLRIVSIEKEILLNSFIKSLLIFLKFNPDKYDNSIPMKLLNNIIVRVFKLANLFEKFYIGSGIYVVASDIQDI